MREQPPLTTARQRLDPAAADAVRAYATKTREDADRLAAVLEDIAANGLPAVEECTPGRTSATPASHTSPRSAQQSPDGPQARPHCL